MSIQDAFMHTIECGSLSTVSVGYLVCQILLSDMWETDNWKTWLKCLLCRHTIRHKSTWGLTNWSKHTSAWIESVWNWAKKFTLIYLLHHNLTDMRGKGRNMREIIARNKVSGKFLVQSEAELNTCTGTFSKCIYTVSASVVTSFIWCIGCLRQINTTSPTIKSSFNWEEVPRLNLQQACELCKAVRLGWLFCIQTVT